MSSKENLSLITNYEQLLEFLSLEGIGEPRNTEFKNGNDWDHLKYKITKALIGLSNLKDGGKVIVGIKDNVNDPDSLIGMTEEQSKTYTLDNIMKFVNEYADPSLEIKIHIFPNNDEEKKYFVIINVLEFLELPTLCKKDGGSGILQREKIYIRPRKNTETTDNFSHHDMRELLELATEKYYVKQKKLCEKFKKLDEMENENLQTQEQFDKEVSDF